MTKMVAGVSAGTEEIEQTPGRRIKVEKGSDQDDAGRDF